MRIFQGCKSDPKGNLCAKIFLVCILIVAFNLVGNHYLNVLTGLILLAEVAVVKCMDSTTERGREMIPVIFAAKELRTPFTIILKAQ